MRVPSHNDMFGNERTDELAASAHQLPPADVPLNSKDMCFAIQRDHPTAAPRPTHRARIETLPVITTQQRLLRLHVGCVWPQTHRQRLTVSLLRTCATTVVNWRNSNASYCTEMFQGIAGGAPEHGHAGRQRQGADPAVPLARGRQITKHCATSSSGRASALRVLTVLVCGAG